MQSKADDHWYLQLFPINILAFEAKHSLEVLTVLIL